MFTLSLIFLVLTGAAYAGALIYAARVARYKRELYIVKAVITGYFCAMALSCLAGHEISGTLERFLVPALSTLFAALTISLYIDSRKVEI
jgi:hypothetical protein